jgi:tRNA (guanine-N7-)-methyltransferase
MARWGLTVEGPQLSFEHIFGEASEPGSEFVLDIGFGGGEALVEVAELRPHECVIGVDVHTPGVAAVLEVIEARGLRNVRVVEGDVLDFAARIPAQSLAAIRVFFPDPWPKRRQLKRRLIRPDIAAQLAGLLREGGTLHMATDSADYAEQMRDVCDRHASLTGGVIERPSWRPVTRFEQRGIDEGRRVVDLVYSASPSSSSASSSAPR